MPPPPLFFLFQHPKFFAGIEICSFVLFILWNHRCINPLENSFYLLLVEIKFKEWNESNVPLLHVNSHIFGSSPGKTWSTPKCHILFEFFILSAAFPKVASWFSLGHMGPAYRISDSPLKVWAQIHQALAHGTHLASPGMPGWVPEGTREMTKTSPGGGIKLGHAWKKGRETGLERKLDQLIPQSGWQGLLKIQCSQNCFGCCSLDCGSGCESGSCCCCSCHSCDCGCDCRSSW